MWRFVGCQRGYGHDTEGKIRWFEQGVDPEMPWVEHVIGAVPPAFAQSLDVADMDGDGHLDIVVGEHTNPSTPGLRAMIFEQVDGDTWFPREVFAGDEHHDGTQLVDLDLDGDLDIISIGWLHRNILIYENLAVG